MPLIPENGEPQAQELVGQRVLRRLIGRGDGACLGAATGEQATITLPDHPGCPSGPVTFRREEFKGGTEVIGPASYPRVIIGASSIVYGDLTGDGEPEAVLGASCWQGEEERVGRPDPRRGRGLRLHRAPAAAPEPRSGHRCHARRRTDRLSGGHAALPVRRADHRRWHELGLAQPNLPENDPYLVDLDGDGERRVLAVFTCGRPLSGPPPGTSFVAVLQPRTDGSYVAIDAIPIADGWIIRGWRYATGYLTLELWRDEVTQEPRYAWNGEYFQEAS